MYTTIEINTKCESMHATKCNLKANKLHWKVSCVRENVQDVIYAQYISTHTYTSYCL